MLQHEASADRHDASEREEWNGTSSYWVSSSLCSIEIDVLHATVAVALVLCGTHIFHMVVHRENNICLILGVKDEFVNNWKLILALLCTLEKEMGTHSCILAWRIPWREEPGRLQSTGSQIVGHDWGTSLSWLECSGWGDEAGWAVCILQRYIKRIGSWEQWVWQPKSSGGLQGTL